MKILSLFLIIALSFALFDDNLELTRLDEKNWYAKVVSSDELWLVAFYAPWDSKSKELEPEFEKTAKSLKGIVNFGHVDMTQFPDIGRQYRVEGYPTLVFFGLDKKLPQTYEGSLKASGIVPYLLKQIKKISLDRLGEPEDLKIESDQNVQLIGDDQFKEIEKSSDAYVVHFFAPWSGKSAKLHAEFNAAAQSLQGKAKFVKIDGSLNSKQHSKYHSEQYPTVVFFPASNKKNFVVYKGESLSSSDIQQFVKKNLDGQKTDL